MSTTKMPLTMAFIMFLVMLFTITTLPAAMASLIELEKGPAIVVNATSGNMTADNVNATADGVECELMNRPAIDEEEN